MYKTERLCAPEFVLLIIVQRRWLSEVRVCFWGCGEASVTSQLHSCSQNRLLSSDVILWIRLIRTLWVFCILLFLDLMGWRTEKTFMKFIYRAFCPLIHFLIILALPPSHSLVTDIRAAHSTLVLIKSNRNKPEPITCTARWADLSAEGIHLEGDGTWLFGVTMKKFLWEVFQRQVWWISPVIYLSDL